KQTPGQRGTNCGTIATGGRWSTVSSKIWKMRSLSRRKETTAISDTSASGPSHGRLRNRAGHNGTTKSLFLLCPVPSRAPIRRGTAGQKGVASRQKAEVRKLDGNSTLVSLGKPDKDRGRRGAMATRSSVRAALKTLAGLRARPPPIG